MPTTDPRVFPAPLQETRLVRLDGAGIQAVPEQDEVPPVPDDLAARDEVEPSMGERLRQEQDETGEGETP